MTTYTDRLDRAEKALSDAAQAMARAKTREEAYYAEGRLNDAARELREAESELARLSMRRLIRARPTLLDRLRCIGIRARAWLTGT